MMENDKKQSTQQQESLEFVTRHYRAGAFSAEDGLERLSAEHGIESKERQWWRGRGIAAAAVVGAVLVASAAIYTFIAKAPANDGKDVNIEQVNTAVDAANISQKIAFNDADLATVVKEIETVYGVNIENVPTESYRLTLSYEGTAKDLVETINDLLDIQLKIAE